MKPLITVFTPTYNRAYTLPKCYESLKNQSCKDFIWLIVDDGSTDNTRQIVEEWIKEDVVNIKYYYQQNQGMHGAHNTAYEHIDTELNVCIDSDDYMTTDAIRKIVDFWEANKSSSYAGIIALDIGRDGKVIGKPLPEHQKTTTLTGYYANGGKGDKKLIYRTAVMKQYPPYPLFEGEKYVGLNYKYIMADQDYELLILNEGVCVVEYLPDGSSLNMYKQYKRNPRGFAELRKVKMTYALNYRGRFKDAIHYVSSSIFSKNKRFLKESPYKITTFLAIPFGCLLHLFIQYKVSHETLD